MLQIEDLHVRFDTRRGAYHAVNGVSFSVGPGEVVGLVGESGSGKSVTALSIMGLLDASATITRGSIKFGGQELLGSSMREWQRRRGNQLSMVFQEPFAALNPLMRVGDQIMEVIRAHNPGIKAREGRRQCVELLTRVNVPNAERRVRQYPHQFSGGMAQRVAIAIAIANRPQLLIADEPTTALDVTVQAQVMRTLKEFQRDSNTAILLITHDLPLIASIAQRLVVLYAGTVVETGPVARVLGRPQHPYTRALLQGVPSLDVRAHRLTPIPGQPPDMATLSVGCPFEPRCVTGAGIPQCLEHRPELRASDGDHVACHFPLHGDAEARDVATERT